MNYKHHIIHNFPENYPWWKKILANIVFFFGGMIIHERKNLLNNWDFIRATHQLKKGDVVLVGGLRRLTGIVIGSEVTHGLIYLGKRRFVHSVADGVEYTSLHETFCEYDTMVILRPKSITNSEIILALNYAENQIGKPYNYDLENEDHGAFYCTQLIESAYMSVGFISISKNHDLTRPIDFINDRFKIISLSHNLQIKNNVLQLK